MPLKEFTFLDVYRRNAEFFPDRTAFVFEGQGRIGEYVGGYEDWQDSTSAPLNAPHSFHIGIWNDIPKCKIGFDI